ncbi:MAG TPA: BadF/BadG/BcrA/BcrD ATPase family protein [Gaiellaceae bacterium]|jgi:N-acetylglucosamine kinase-like BadF-type ATPase
MTAPIVLAVDGGNSKTDLALVRDDGSVLSVVRGPLSSPHHLGVDGCLDVLEGLLGDAVREAGLSRADGPVAEVGKILLAGIDFPREEEELQRLAGARAWAARTSVANDTFAVLRAGTERGWGVAVVCGAGINCVGVAPDGRQARFLSLGATTGDWGGGFDVGLAAVSAAARSEDGRGPKTTLEQAVPAHFGLSSPQQLAEAIHLGSIPLRRVVELPPLVFAEAAHDEVAAGILDRLASEVVALARAALARLELTGEPVEVLLGGGLLQGRDGYVHEAIEAGLRNVGPNITVHTAASVPVVGAALLGLDELSAGPEAQARLRRELGAAVNRLGKEES